MPKKRARKKNLEQPIGVLLMELTDVHCRLLAMIEDPTVRARWEDELEVHTELIYQATKDAD